MGRFSGVSEASQFNEGGAWFRDGSLLVLIDAVKVGETRKNIEFFVIEHTIVRSTNPELPPGSQVSNMFTRDKDAYFSNINHFCSVAKNCAPEEVDDAGVEMIVSRKNPLRGIILRARAKTIQTRAGNDFTKIVYSHINGADFELLESEGILLPTGKSTPLKLLPTNPFNDEDDGPAFVP